MSKCRSSTSETGPWCGGTANSPGRLICQLAGMPPCLPLQPSDLLDAVLGVQERPQAGFLETGRNE